MQITHDDRDVLGFDEIDRADVARVGGKGANLGELSRLEGVRVPAGFVVTTAAFRRIVAAADVSGRIARLAGLDPEHRGAIRTGSAEVRAAIEAAPIPGGVVAAITTAVAALTRSDHVAAFAVRSSATAEDLPTASFAGQHDTSLNVAGDAVLDHVRRCWASAFTERAVTYRLRNGHDHRAVDMAVVVQELVDADVAGVLFTADPVTGHRRLVSIEATFGLGEALVAGQVVADNYRVRDGVVVGRSIGAKPVALRPAPGGGTRPQPVEAEQNEPALSEAQVLRLAALGRRIEAHLGAPQDIEWCLADGELHVVQSRPITTLFPVPDAGDDERHVYVSVGHQQMMTDPMTPLGISMWRLAAARPMYSAGGRLFVDVAAALASPAARAGLIETLGSSDPLIGDALRTVVERGDLLPAVPVDVAPPPGTVTPAAPIETDPAIVTDLMRRSEASVAALERALDATTGDALFAAIVDDVAEMKRLLWDPRSMQVLGAGIEARQWLDAHLREWLGETNAADLLTRSVPNNVTAEMGLALLDVADAIRPHPDVVAFLSDAPGDGFLDELPSLEGGDAARRAIAGYLERYGMRGVGEIDIARPRWSERPTTLLPLILANVRNFEPGAGPRRFEEGRRQAAAKEQELLARLATLPDGDRRAVETAAMIDRVRTFAGYREYPKYSMISRFFVYKQALLREVDRLVDAGVLERRDDSSLLTFEELREAVRTGRVDGALIRRRRDEMASFRALVPPRVLTSDGEIVAGTYRREDLPADALIGLPVSAGVVEGRARVILDLADADVDPGDILVTVATDPSWSPLFVAIGGLVTEVGGLMTHGTVIAREYGLPAVVGVEHATRLVVDGQRIRLDGTRGTVEVLASGPSAAG